MNRFSKFQKIATVIFVSIILLLYTMAVWDTSSRNTSVRERQSYNSQTYASQANEKIENTCLVLDGASRSKCIRDIIESTNEHDRSERDLVAQTDMAVWAFWMAVISGLMFVATAFGVVFVYKTLSATREMVREAEKTTVAAQETANISREIGQSQIRAYLTCTGGNFFFTKDFFRCKVFLKNSGQSPARNITLDAKVLPTKIMTVKGSKSTTTTSGGTRAISGVCEEIPAGSQSDGDLTIHQVEFNDGAFERISDGGHISINCLATWRDVFNRAQSGHFFLMFDGDIPIDANEPMIHRKGKLRSYNQSPNVSQSQSDK